MTASIATENLSSGEKLTAQDVADRAYDLIVDKLHRATSAFTYIYLDESVDHDVHHVGDTIEVDHKGNVVPVPLDRISDVTFGVTSKDMTSTIDEFERSFLLPATEGIVQQINRQLLTLRGFDVNAVRVHQVKYGEFTGLDESVVFASAALELPPFANGAAVVSGGGFSLRVTFGYDIARKQSQVSIDVLYGIRDTAA